MLGQPSAICFDVGGTLVFPSGAFISRICEELLGQSIAPRLCRDSICRASRDRNLDANPLRFNASDEFGALWGRHAGVAESAASRIWPRIMAADTRQTPLWTVVHPEAVPTLRALTARGVRLAAVSNADGRLLHDLEVLGLLPYFEIAIDSREAGVEKPDPTIFSLALERLGARATDCWCVGNEYVFDLVPARAAGIGTTILYDRLDLYPATLDCVRIRHLTELVELVGQEAA